MTERIKLPPPWCAALCRNAMSEVCIENCAIKRDCSGFKEKQGLKLEDMPPMPKMEELQTREEKFAALYIYTSKLVEERQGEANGHLPPITLRRSYPHTETGRRILAGLPIQSVLHDLTPTTTTLEVGSKREDLGVPAETVASPAD